MTDHPPGFVIAVVDDDTRLVKSLGDLLESAEFKDAGAQDPELAKRLDLLTEAAHQSVKQLTEQMGGSVAVASDPGRSTRFEVRLPVLQPPDEKPESG